MFEVQAHKPGTIDLALEGTDRRSRIEVVKPKDLAIEAAHFVQAGGLANVPGVFREARLGERTLATATTVEKNGEGFTSFMMPDDVDEGPENVTLVDENGNSKELQTFVYRVISGRVDNPVLLAGQRTQGEFVVCFGNAQPGQQLFANLTIIGFLRFLDPDAKGQVLHRSLTVEGTGMARIPFRILAIKGAGPGVPFTIHLSLSSP
jgi:hypothetical protein